MKKKNLIRVEISIGHLNDDGSYSIVVCHDDFEASLPVTYPVFGEPCFIPCDDWTLRDQIEKILKNISDFYDKVAEFSALAELSALNETRYLE